LCPLWKQASKQYDLSLYYWHLGKEVLLEQSLRDQLKMCPKLADEALVMSSSSFSHCKRPNEEQNWKK